MLITYLGHSSFKIKTNTATIVTDPYSFATGLHFPKTEADIVTISHDHEDHSYRDGIKGDNTFIIEGPGEYEIKEIMIKGFKTFHDNTEGKENGKNTIYMIHAEGVTLAHLGDLGHEPNDKQMKELEETNILFIPVGGVYTIDAQMATKLIKQIEPEIVIPMHYKQPGLSEYFNALAPLDAFKNEFGLEGETMEKLTVNESSLPEEIQMVILERK